MLTIFLLSLIGVPLTGGFFGKFYIFKAALESHLVWLTVLGLLNSAVAAYYYLRILVVMYMKEPSEAASKAEPLSPGLSAALLLARRRQRCSWASSPAGCWISPDVPRTASVAARRSRSRVSKIIRRAINRLQPFPPECPLLEL